MKRIIFIAFTTILYSNYSIGQSEINMDNTMYVQTDEEFLAEAFFSESNAKNSKIYIEVNCYRTAISNHPKGYELLCKDFGICDTLIVQELYTYYKENSTYPMKWNFNDPVFKKQEYKHLKFEENSKRKNVKYFSKPLFTNDRRYALIEVTRHTYHKYGWRYRLTVKPWKNIWKSKHYHDSTGHNFLFKREDGKWIFIGEYLTVIHHGRSI